MQIEFPAHLGMSLVCMTYLVTRFECEYAMALCPFSRTADTNSIHQSCELQFKLHFRPALPHQHTSLDVNTHSKIVCNIRSMS